MCVLLALLPACAVRAADAPALYRLQTIAGSSLNGDGGPATQAQIGAIQGVALDSAGNLYLSDSDHHRIRKVSTAGIIVTIAGNGTAGFTGDAGPATAAQLNLPYGIAVDSAGNLYIADLGNSRIRRVSPDGIISTYAGGGAAGASDEGMPAVSTSLRTPRNLAIDAAGNLYFSEFEGHRIRKVTPDGRIATIAGTGIAGFTGDGGPAIAAELAYPAGLALDRAGSVYIADSQNRRIRKINLDGSISTAAGTAATLGFPTAVVVLPAGTLYASDGSGAVRVCPGSGACSSLNGTTAAGDLALDSAGNLYVADGPQIRKIDPHGQLTLIAGDDYQHAIGDGGLAAAAQLDQPSAVAFDVSSNLYIADTGSGRVRQVSPSGIIQTIAGPQNLNSPGGIAVDPAGDILIADTGDQLIRNSADGAMFTVAGTGTAGAGAEGLPPAQTALSSPRGVCTAADGSLYIADTGNHRVLRLPPGGTLQIAAGNGSPVNTGDGGPARLAQLNQPSACFIDAAGDLSIADSGNNRVRKVAAGLISTIAGGDGTLNSPRGVAVDANGNIFIADTGNNRLCKLSAGALETIAGPDQLSAPGGLAFDTSGNLYVADTGNNRIAELTAAIQTMPVTIANAASLQAGPVSPGELVAISGSGIGPANATAGAFDSARMLPRTLGGWEIHFDSSPAPLLGAQSGRIDAQVPYTLTGATTHIEVFAQGQLISATDVPVVPATPALFPASLTQANPAVRGSIAVFYATGVGLTTVPNLEGQAASPPYPQPTLPLSLTIAGFPAQLIYAAAAPDTAGLLQINAVVPGGFVPSGPASVVLGVGDAVSPPITIWIQ